MKDIDYGPFVVFVMCAIIVIGVVIDSVNRWRKRA